ncbi:MAG: transglutaminase domain-containing protein [Bacillaceae bacterium]|nr:transglutaminase domain-containing protein [Bacillaceae bacterium]
MSNSTHSERTLYSLLMHLFGFLLLLEWVRPLSEITETGNLYVFVVFIGVAFTLSYLQLVPILKITIQAGFLLYFLHSLYFVESFLSKAWFAAFWSHIKYNVNVMMMNDWSAMSNLFRTLLLFVLLWLISYLLIYWILYRKKMFLFVVMTVTYVAILDTFTIYDGSMAIVRLMFVGMLIVGFVYMESLREKEGLFKDNKIWIAWGIPLVVFVFVSTTVGYLSPKAEPIWPDPVPFLTSVGEGIGNGTGDVKKIGYGEDDSRLGGPFIGDPTVVFKAEANRRHYWRVESKDIYTGKGWDNTYDEINRVDNGDITSFHWFTDEVSTDNMTATLYMQLKYPHINYPMGVTKVEVLDEDVDVRFEFNESTQKIVTRNSSNNNEVLLDSYSVEYEFPTFYIERLKEVQSGTGYESDADFYDRYTQLPSSLPNRVKNLAEEITSPFQSRYDKVVAVERYFARNGFEYETTEVAVPKGNADYVDQFLFETQMGYCDNFSTSMVVLLRSVGIPARWVKGYTEGEFVAINADGKRVYEIANNNAHSWVEVYFPEVGWVTFEPTSGFDNPYRFTYESISGSGENDNGEEEFPERAEENAENRERNELELPEEKADRNNTPGFDFTFNVTISWKVVGIVAGLLILVSLSLWITRSKWSPHLYIYLYKNRKDEKVFPLAYAKLLRHMQVNGFTREQGQTLREYAKQIDGYFKTSEMQTLTERYERVLYRGNSSKEEWEKSIELWENLIKKRSS